MPSIQSSIPEKIWVAATDESLLSTSIGGVDHVYGFALEASVDLFISVYNTKRDDGAGITPKMFKTKDILSLSGKYGASIVMVDMTIGGNNVILTPPKNWDRN
jgi:hypothetical protein